MMLLSAAKVARRWESWGEAASRRSGGGLAIAFGFLVGERADGGVEPGAT